MAFHWRVKLAADAPPRWPERIYIRDYVAITWAERRHIVEVSGGRSLAKSEEFARQRSWRTNSLMMMMMLDYCWVEECNKKNLKQDPLLGKLIVSSISYEWRLKITSKLIYKPHSWKSLNNRVHVERSLLIVLADRCVYLGPPINGGDTGRWVRQGVEYAQWSWSITNQLYQTIIPQTAKWQWT